MPIARSRSLAIKAKSRRYGLPGTPIGLWCAHNYDAAAKVIPNEMSTAPRPRHLNRAPRRLFLSSGYYSLTACTAVDDAATAPDGSNDASSVTGATAWRFGPASGSLPAGTYTVACWVMRNGSIDQSFCFTANGLSTRSSAFTATSAWQRFTYTFTLSVTTNMASTVMMCCNAALDPANLLICDFEIFLGAVDLGHGLFGAHMTVDASPADTLTTFASNVLDFSNAGYAVAQTQTEKSLTSSTAVMLIARTTPKDAAAHPILGKPVDYTSFTLMAAGSAGGPQIYCAGSGGFQSGASTQDQQPLGYIALAFRIGSKTNAVFINGVRVGNDKASAPTSVSLKSMLLGTFYGPAFAASKSKVLAVAFYDRDLSDAEVQQASGAIAGIGARSGISINAQPIVVFEGDSISAFAYSYNEKVVANIAGQRPVIVNRAIAGSTLNGYLSIRASQPDNASANSSVDSMLPNNVGGRRAVLTVLIGANDIASAGSSTQYITDLRAYCLARKKAGWKVLICTILPRTSPSPFNTERNLVNADIVANFVSGGYADAVADFAANTTMGADSSSTNTTYYSDGVHPTDAGHVILETIFRPVLNGLLA